MTVTILTGDCRDVLRTLPDRSVHCCVTSPPYFGLRDYGTATWVGGDVECLHKGTTLQSQSSTLSGNGHGGDKPLSPYLQSQGVPFRKVCGLCGALRVDSQMGLEPTPDAFVAQLVVVFQEVRRVLRDDGTLWLVLGDTYQNAKGQSGGIDPKQPARRHGLRPQDVTPPGFKPKDRLMIPARVALALQADGWWLRDEIIWHKPNVMPSSVTDRTTPAHEMLYMLTKSRRYHYDMTAIKEKAVSTHRSGNGYKRPEQIVHGGRGDDKGWEITDQRQPRSVWSINTKPFKGAHFATFPPDLVQRCILAGCPIGGTVLDPFGGAGTTAMVAQQHGRHAILIELNPDYAAMAQRRVGVSEPMPPIPPRQRRPWRIQPLTTRSVRRSLTCR